MATDSSNWPGEWHPSRHDVALASEAPDITADFKTRLLASEDAHGISNLMHLDLSRRSSISTYTYPLALLSDLPPIPEHFELLRLWQEFLDNRQTLPFLQSVPVPSKAKETLAPHLLLAAAPIALLLEGDSQRANDTFPTAFSIWSAIIEIDNRDARTEESLIAGMLLCLYSSLASDLRARRWSKLLNYAVTTIARRRRLHDYRLLEDRLSLGSHRSTVATLWLADILQALHLDAALNFSTQEIHMTVIQSDHALQDLRTLLLRNEQLPADFQGRDDALLLLLALLADAIYLQRSLGRWSSPPDTINPFVPLSPYSEHQGMLATLDTGLGRWLYSFDSIDEDIKVLYHYIRLYLAMPELTSMAPIIGYPDTIVAKRPDTKVPDTAAKIAWQILDTTAQSTSVKDTMLHSPWLPVVVFHAALVIWTDIVTSTSHYAPSKRILVPFVLELRHMRWPCCERMAATLETLIADKALPGP